MRLSFEISVNRIQEIINCIHEESELNKRINSFEIIKLDCRDEVLNEVFVVSLNSDNAYFIQRMAEAAREKTEEEMKLEKYYKGSCMDKVIAALLKPSCAGAEVGSIELKHYDETAISSEDQDGREA